MLYPIRKKGQLKKVALFIEIYYLSYEMINLFFDSAPLRLDSYNFVCRNA